MNRYAIFATLALLVGCAERPKPPLVEKVIVFKHQSTEPDMGLGFTSNGDVVFVPASCTIYRLFAEDKTFIQLI